MSCPFRHRCSLPPNRARGTGDGPCQWFGGLAAAAPGAADLLPCCKRILRCSDCPRPECKRQWRRILDEIRSFSRIHVTVPAKDCRRIEAHGMVGARGIGWVNSIQTLLARSRQFIVSEVRMRKRLMPRRPNHRLQRTLDMQPPSLTLRSSHVRRR